MKLIQLQAKDLPIMRKKLWLQNDEVCPLLQIKVPFDKTTLDHIHKLKNEECSETKGVIRNTIDFRANGMEGKIVNNWKRYFGADEKKHPISLPYFLRNLADYLEKGAYIEDDTCFIHSTEKVKEQKVSKSNYNKLKKAYLQSGAKKKFPEFPKSMKLTKDLGLLFEKFGIAAYN